jgi:hypothetical protein
LTEADAAIEAGVAGALSAGHRQLHAGLSSPAVAGRNLAIHSADRYMGTGLSIPELATTHRNTGATVMTAREMGVRSLTVVTEPTPTGCGTTGNPACTVALYAGTVTSGAIFEPGHTVGGWPPPRILRSVDGVTWTPLSQDTGTFLGNLSQPSTQGASQTFQNFGIRSGGQLNGVLYLQVGDYSGVGQVIGSIPGSNPMTGGDNNYQYVSPPADIARLDSAEFQRFHVCRHRQSLQQPGSAHAVWRVEDERDGHCTLYLDADH